MEIEYKDSNNQVHQIEEGYEHLMVNWPIGYTRITDAEAIIIQQLNNVPLTYQQLRAAEYPSMFNYLDGIVKGDLAQQQTYITACLAVKLKYPKV